MADILKALVSAGPAERLNCRSGSACFRGNRVPGVVRPAGSMVAVGVDLVARAFQGSPVLAASRQATPSAARRSHAVGK